MVALELASWRKRIALAPFSRRMSLAAACLTFEQLLRIPAHYFADCRSFWPLRQVVPSCQLWLPSCNSRAASCWVLVQQTILGSRCTHEVSLQEFEQVKAVKGIVSWHLQKRYPGRLIMTHLQRLVSHGYCQDYLLFEQQRRHQEAVDFLFGGSYKKDWSSSAGCQGWSCGLHCSLRCQ